MFFFHKTLLGNGIILELEICGIFGTCLLRALRGRDYLMRNVFKKTTDKRSIQA